MKLLTMQTLLSIVLLGSSISFAAEQELDITDNKFGLTGKCVYHEEKQKDRVLKFVTCTDSEMVFPVVASFLGFPSNVVDDSYYIGKIEQDGEDNTIYVFSHPLEVITWGGGDKPVLTDQI